MSVNGSSKKIFDQVFSDTPEIYTDTLHVVDNHTVFNVHFSLQHHNKSLTIFMITMLIVVTLQISVVNSFVIVIKHLTHFGKTRQMNLYDVSVINYLISTVCCNPT